MPSGFVALRDEFAKMLSPDDPPLALAAAWALVWTGLARLPSTPPEPHVMRSLFVLWREAESSELRRFAAWAFATQPLLARDTFVADFWGDCDAWFEETAPNTDQGAPLVLAWYRCTPWNDSELAEKLRKIGERMPFPIARDLLATLGDPGRCVLEEWEAKELKR